MTTELDKRRMSGGSKLSVEQFAQEWGVSKMTVYRLLKSGELVGAVKVRHQWRIPADALERHVGATGI